MSATAAKTPHPVILIPGLDTATWTTAGILIGSGEGDVFATVVGDTVQIDPKLGRVHTGLVRTALECLRARGFQIPGEG